MDIGGRFFVVGFVICLSFVPPSFAATDAEAVAEANNSSAIDLYREIGGSDPGANIFFSPFKRIRRPCNGLHRGKGGNGVTDRLRRSTSHFPGSGSTLPLPKLRPHLKEDNWPWQTPSGDKKGVKFRREFLDIADRCYHGMLREVDFEQPGSSLRHQPVDRGEDEGQGKRPGAGPGHRTLDTAHPHERGLFQGQLVRE